MIENKKAKIPRKPALCLVLRGVFYFQCPIFTRLLAGYQEKFIDLAMELGDVEGMSLQDIKNYIHYIADWRLTQLKLPTLYGYFKKNEGQYQQVKEHPLPWLISILNGVEHANFFEQRATEYAKTVTQGQWDGDTGVWRQFELKMVAG